MPKMTKVTGKLNSAYTKSIESYGIRDENGNVVKVLKYAGHFEELLPGDDIPPKEYPDLKQILKWVINRRKASARQKAMQAACDTAGIPKPTLDDPEVQFKQMVKILMKSGRSEEDARDTANENLGTEFGDEVTV